MAEHKRIPISDIFYPPASSRLRPPPNPDNKAEWEEFLLTKESIAERGLDNIYSVRIGDDGKYYLMDGSRRHTAMKMLLEEGHERVADGLVDVMIHNKTELEALKSQIVGNYHHKKTTNGAFVEACMKIINSEGCSIAELAKQLGMSESYLLQLLRIKNLPEKMFQAFEDGTLKNVGNAMQLSKLPTDVQEEMFPSACQMTNADFGAKVTEVLSERAKAKRAEAKGKEPEFDAKPITPSRDEVQKAFDRACKLIEKDPESEYYRGACDFMKKLFKVDEQTLAERKADWERDQEEKRKKKEQQKSERKYKAEQQAFELMQQGGYIPEDAEFVPTGSDAE